MKGFVGAVLSVAIETGLGIEAYAIETFGRTGGGGFEIGSADSVPECGGDAAHQV